MWWHRRKLTKKMKLRNKGNSKSDTFSDFRKQKEDMVEFQLPQKTEESAPSEIELRIPNYDSEIGKEDDEISLIEEIGNNVFQEEEEEEEEEDLFEYFIREEFAMLFNRLELEMDDKADINAIYRALCGRSPCDPKLAFFCDKFEQYYMHKNPENGLLTNLDYFDKVTAMAILDGWERSYIYDIAYAFKSDSIDVKMNDPVNVVVLSTLIALEMFSRFPQSVVMRGRFIYATGEALKYLDFLMVDHDEKLNILHQINSLFGTPEISDVSALLRHCMDSGLGWLSAEKHGRMIHNHIIKTIVYDEIPEYLLGFQNYQLCQFIMNIICGGNDGYAITEHFTLCNEENWKKLQKFLSIDIKTRVRIIADFLDDRLIMLGNEIICHKTSKEFDIINKKRENIRENISDCVKWLSDFCEYVQLD